MTSQQMREKIIADPSASYWLKEQLKKMDDRDPVDAINDVEVLAEYCTARFAEVSGRQAGVK